MPANTKPISSRNAAQEAFENEKLAAQSMNAARAASQLHPVTSAASQLHPVTSAASQLHPVTKGVTEPLMRITEGLKKKGMKSGGMTKKGKRC